MTARHTLFVGIGSPHGDDQIGWQIAELLESHPAKPAHVSIRRAATPSQLLDWLDGVDRLVLCDAVRGTSSPIAALSVAGVCDSGLVYDNPDSQSPTTEEATEHLAEKATLEVIQHRWHWPTPLIARVRSAGSHAFGMPSVLRLAEQLGHLPPEVVVIGIEGTHFDVFSEMSASLRNALPNLAYQIAEDLFVPLLPHGAPEGCHA